jgi:hypothetical protein
MSGDAQHLRPPTSLSKGQLPWQEHAWMLASRDIELA